jgi:hypothetical protein
MVIEGDTGPHPLICTPEWAVYKDTEKAFNMSGGYYTAPFPGNYNIISVLKTISTSVTANIIIEHQDSKGKIRRSYTLDQGALTNESTAQLIIMDVNTNDRLHIMIQTRFNLKLVGREILTNENDKTTYSEYYNILQIVYMPPMGFVNSPSSD